MWRAWLGGSIKMRAPQTKLRALIHDMRTEEPNTLNYTISNISSYRSIKIRAPQTKLRALIHVVPARRGRGGGCHPRSHRQSHIPRQTQCPSHLCSRHHHPSPSPRWSPPPPPTGRQATPPTTSSVISDSQHHHRISGIFKRYLFRGKPRENPHHMWRATGMGNGGGSNDGGDSCWSRPTKVNLAPRRRTPTWDSASLLSSSGDR